MLEALQRNGVERHPRGSRGRHPTPQLPDAHAQARRQGRARRRTRPAWRVGGRDERRLRNGVETPTSPICIYRLPNRIRRVYRSQLAVLARSHLQTPPQFPGDSLLSRQYLGQSESGGAGRRLALHNLRIHAGRF
ncbi:MAG: hypothetical protein MZV64_28040 [Ignavibacteriales bacterium]|nr:hypothetical protein [Ignavibacteriales bacterium]